MLHSGCPPIREKIILKSHRIIRSCIDMARTQEVVKVRDTHLFVDDTGEADLPVILCLHSLFLDSRMFDGLVEAAAGKFRVIRPEFRGQGRSDLHDVDVITMDENAEDILALMDSM